MLSLSIVCPSFLTGQAWKSYAVRFALLMDKSFASVLLPWAWDSLSCAASLRHSSTKSIQTLLQYCGVRCHRHQMTIELPKHQNHMTARDHHTLTNVFKTFPDLLSAGGECSEIMRFSQALHSCFQGCHRISGKVAVNLGFQAVQRNLWSVCDIDGRSHYANATNNFALS